MTDLKKIKEKTTETAEFLKELGAYLDDNFLVEGYTLSQWKKYFKIELPEDVSFPVIVEKAKEITSKYQKAAYYRDKQNVQMNILEQSESEEYGKAYNHARIENERKFNKPLAAESCKMAAADTPKVKGLKDAIATQGVIRDFWVKTCSTLVEVRKLLEQMGYALSADARLNKDFVVTGDKDGSR